MDQIEILNELGMIDPSDKNYRPRRNWNSMLEALKQNKSPEAQALLGRLNRKYDLKKIAKGTGA